MSFLDALALTLLKMNVFIRLQKKLGWSTPLLDRLLRCFVRPGVEELSLSNWQESMRTALIYISHLQEISERTKKRVALEELLILWAPIPTTGIASLYERLFLNPCARAQNPVFKYQSGGYLVGCTEPVVNHVDTVRQALQVSYEEIEEIFAHAKVEEPKLSIENLSILMRYKVLSRAIDMSVPDLLTLLSHSKTRPFQELLRTPVQGIEDDVPFFQTISFLREVDLVREAGIGAETIEGLCCHRGPSIDTIAWSDLTDRLLMALSALPEVEALNPGADSNDTNQRHCLAVLQTLSAQIGVPEPLVTTLVTSVLKAEDVAPTKPLLETIMSVRCDQIQTKGKKWMTYVWFPATGTYKIEISPSNNAELKFGPKDDVQLVETNGTGAHEPLTVHVEVRAGGRYRLELTLPDNGPDGNLSIQGNAPATSLPVDEYVRFSSAVTRLRKAVDVLTSLGISQAELDYIHSTPDAFSLDVFPITPVSTDEAAKETFVNLLQLIQIAAARRHYGAGDRVVEVLQAAKRKFDTTDTDKATLINTFNHDLQGALKALTGWKEEFIKNALSAIGLTTTEKSTAETLELEVSALKTSDGLRRVTDAIAALIRLGLNPEKITQWSKKPIDSDVTIQFRASLKGRYLPDVWRQVALPIFDALRKKQRDALVAHLTHLPDAPYGETPEQLFESLLLDPGTEPPVFASRIQLAISSVQLFVQRCLMNLEMAVDPSIIDAKRWEWMRRFRVWEVNRKMFLWPENWLEPEFRDDKTHLFRDLEGALLQGDVSNDLVRNALFTYLKGLEGLARLEMMTMFFEPGASADGSVVHVIGRTPNAPHKYFYRKCSHRMWTPWEPMDVEIDGEHLALTEWRGRMHLFWVTFFEKAEGKEIPKKKDDTNQSFNDIGSGTPSALEADRAVQLQLNWVEQAEGKWTNRSSTQTFLDAPIFKGKRASDTESKRKFFIHVEVDPIDTEELGDDILELHITHVDGGMQKFVMFSKLAPPALLPQGKAPAPPPMSATTPSATKWAGNSPFSVTFTAEYKLQDGTNTASTKDEFPILRQGGDYKLLFPSNEIRLGSGATIPHAAGKASGFIFSPQGAQHVVYRGTDRSIHDVWWTPNGWFHCNASAAASADSASDDPHGYPLDDQHLYCIAYVSDCKLLEICWSQMDSLGPGADEEVATAWRMETLYEAGADADRPVGKPFGGLFSPKRGVVYRTQDGHLWAAVEETTLGAWKQVHLNEGDIPAAVVDPTGCLMTATSLGGTTVHSRHLFFQGSDGNLHELRSDSAGAQWIHTNLTATTGAPKPAANTHPSAYAFLGQKTIHVVYRTQDGTVHELWGKSGSWKHNPIGASYAKADGNPVGYVTEFAGTQHVVYRGKDNQIYELWWGSTAGWKEYVLTRVATDAPVADGDIEGYSFERYGTQHVVYRSQRGELCELRWDPSGWHAERYDLTRPYLDPIGPLIAPFFYEDQSAPHTFFVEPSLVEKTVQDWEEYVLTTEEYVQKETPIPIPIAPWFPGRIDVVPSKWGVLSGRNRDKVFDNDVLLRTPKGVFGARGGLELGMASQTIQIGKSNPVRVLDTTRGSLQDPDKLGRKIMFRQGGVR
ncbi:MAG: neuraminidase-like domain-containing protein [Pseudomonadota bacterium]